MASSDQSGPGESTAVSAQSFVHALTPILAAVTEQIDGPIQQAADLFVTSLRANGVIQAFGSGHSEALAMEIAGRAGGLIASNRIALRDLVLLGGEPVELLHSAELERDPSYSRKLYELSAARDGDLFVIASNSGVNGSIVELAKVVKERGHALIAITSLQHTAGVDSRHPSGKKLIDYADVVLDNHAPYGDSVLDLPGGGKVCAVSSITAALIAQMLVAEVLRRLTDAGETPPVYLSANIPGGDEHNHALEAQYAGRIRRTA
ncbi:SIS domain-containing protein [Kribbella sandramycini]|uniref:Putative phosphosugar-binding protein n=1 Tax=Kribbella sandramycini TaxID=60450 RepID=A0A7Y4L7H8_9ACTN|nr:SIS domain-containing protein [Kribbella sandramycini]MBB6566874.1 putative phosphosugar-binding protein [Kribbella sandramycini]NOL44596.1 SIS domain-containing protein [Kribbella sandramycini]